MWVGRSSKGGLPICALVVAAATTKVCDSVVDDLVT